MMKFETRFGLGEIVATKQRIVKERVYQDELVEIVGVYFDGDRRVSYVGRYSHGVSSTFTEDQLIGDPDFDQETGYHDV